MSQSKTKSARRTFLKNSAVLATASLGSTVQASSTSFTVPAQPTKHAAETRVSISGGSESAFPSPEAPGSRDGGYNIVFILTDQEH